MQLRDAIAAELARLTAPGGPASTDSVRATHRVFADDPQRAIVRKRVIADYLDRSGTPSQGTAAIITAGVPGAGKSSAVDMVLGDAAPEFRRLDADLIKDDLLVDAMHCGLFDDLLSTTLSDGRPIAPRELAALVHHESTQIWDALRRHCIARGEQVVIEGTLTWPPLGTSLLTELSAAGYADITVIAVEVPESVAQQRALNRWWNVRSAGVDELGGRFTPPDVIAHAYQSDGVSVCMTNAAALTSTTLFDAISITLYVVDETGQIVRQNGTG